jgi:hypothetical protein
MEAIYWSEFIYSMVFYASIMVTIKGFEKRVIRKTIEFMKENEPLMLDAIDARIKKKGNENG